MPKYYTVKETEELELLTQEINNLQVRIDEKKSLRPERWETVMGKLKMEWTYDSNAIEGSTLTLGDTIFFLREGLTVEGKPLKDFLDARNHIDAIDFLYDVISDERPITEGLIKEINALLLMNLIFIKKRLPPAVIRNERRRLYLDTLAKADKGELEAFVRFVGESLVSTQKVIAEAL
jgi:Fic family protein